MFTRDGRLYDASNAKMYAGATGGDLHIDGILSNLTIGFRPTGLIADQFAPVVPGTTKQSDGYYVWTRANWLRAGNAVRAPKGTANRLDPQVSTDTYFCKNFALGIETPWEDLANADDALSLRESNSNLIMDNLALNWEIRLAAKVLNTSNVGSSNALGANYGNIATSTPIDDMDNGCESVRSVTGLVPNVAVFGPVTWRRFRKHPDVIDYIRGKGDNAGGGGVTEQQVAAAWGLDRVLVGKGIQNTAGEGISATYSDVWSNHILLAHVAAAPNKMTPSYMYTFQWRPQGFPAPMTVRRYDETASMVEVQEVHQFQDEKVVATELGYLIIGG